MCILRRINLPHIKTCIAFGENAISKKKTPRSGFETLLWKILLNLKTPPVIDYDELSTVIISELRHLELAQRFGVNDETINLNQIRLSTDPQQTNGHHLKWQ